MAPHWTYQPCPRPDAGLEQGDILQPTEELRRIFTTVHPHFADEKYLAFLVTTQSCDLVRRGGVSTAAYVNVAAVRPVSKVIQKLLSNVSKPIARGAFKQSARAVARQLFERLLNQNEQAIGLFYLQPDVDAGLAEAAVAFLRVAIALKVEEHYEALQRARVGRITPEFQAKLGWLVGNLYVRPATPDWADQVGGKEQFERIIGDLLNDARWIDDEIVEEARAWNVDVEGASEKALESLRPPSALNRALEEIHREIVRLRITDAALTVADPDLLRKLQNRLKNNGKFTKLLKGR